MKNHIKILSSACAVIAGLLIASAPVLAQLAPPTPASVAPNYRPGGEAPSLAMPKARTNLYLDAGFQYLRTKMKIGSFDCGNYNFYGANIAFGWRLDEHNKIQVELAGLGAYKDWGGNYTETLGMGVQLFSYGYCIPLGREGRLELRLSPSLGYAYVFQSIDDNGSVDSYGSMTLAYGAGAGLTCHLSTLMYLDVSLRYLNIGGPTLDYSYKDMQSIALTFSCGWKF